MRYLIISSIDPEIRNEPALYLDYAIGQVTNTDDNIYWMPFYNSYVRPDYLPNWCQNTILGPANLRALPDISATYTCQNISIAELPQTLAIAKKRYKWLLDATHANSSNVLKEQIRSISQRIKSRSRIQTICLEWFKHLVSQVHKHRIQHIVMINSVELVILLAIMYHIIDSSPAKSGESNTQKTLSRLFDRAILTTITVPIAVSPIKAKLNTVTVTEYMSALLTGLNLRQIHHLDISPSPKPLITNNLAKIQQLLDVFILKSRERLDRRDGRILTATTFHLPVVLADTHPISSTMVTELQHVVRCLTKQLITMITGEHPIFQQLLNQEIGPVYVSRLETSVEFRVHIDWYTVDCRGYPECTTTCTIPPTEMDELQKNIIQESMAFKMQTCTYGEFYLVFKIGENITHIGLSPELDGTQPLLDCFFDVMETSGNIS